MFTLQLGGVLYIIKQNDYKKTYLPVVEFIKLNAKADKDLIMGSAELGFGLAFPDNFVDDWRLGFNSGKKPEFIVVGKQYEGMFKGMQKSEPETYQYIADLLNQQYDQIYDYNSIKVFRRKRTLHLMLE